MTEEKHDEYTIQFEPYRVVCCCGKKFVDMKQYIAHFEIKNEISKRDPDEEGEVSLFRF
jgi:hypothetical protein